MGFGDANSSVINVAPATAILSRGDVLDYDFEIGDLTCDGTWRDLPIDGIVPVGTKWVLVKVKYRATDKDTSFEMREKGHVGTKSALNVRTQDTSASVYTTELLSVGSDRTWEYKAHAVSSTLSIVIKAWM